MKRLALAAVVLLAACSTKETPAVDTTAAMAPAPAMAVDTGMKMDSMTAAMQMDTAMKKTDTAMKKMEQAKDAMKAAKP